MWAIKSHPSISIVHHADHILMIMWITYQVSRVHHPLIELSMDSIYVNLSCLHGQSVSWYIVSVHTVHIVSISPYIAYVVRVSRDMLYHTHMRSHGTLHSHHLYRIILSTRWYGLTNQHIITGDYVVIYCVISIVDTQYTLTAWVDCRDRVPPRSIHT